MAAKRQPNYDKETKAWLKKFGTKADYKAFANGCRFIQGRADEVEDFFRRFLVHSKGEFGGKPFTLLKWQKEKLFYPLFGWCKRDNRGEWVRRYRKAYIEIPKKNGKPLACDTPVPTPRGWIRQRDLRVGDEVFGMDGVRCRVVAVSETMTGKECFRVSFSDGTSIVAEKSHLWYTEAYRNGLPRTGLGKKSTWEERHIRTTEQIRDTLFFNCSRNVVACNHRIPVCGPIQCDEIADLPIDPYVLGAWLGDGHSATARLTCHEDDGEILENIRRSGVNVSRQKTCNKNAGLFLLGSGGRSQKARDASLSAVLRREGLLNNKHIPAQYLRASSGQRVSLLQGLMDTDGTCSLSGRRSVPICEFCTTNPRLRDDFVELVRSVGYQPTILTRRATIYGKDCGEVYRIFFTAFSDVSPFRLSRKHNRLSSRPAKRPRSQFRQIVSVDPVDSVPVCCVQVDSTNGMYLAGEGMIPTHNSTIASGVGLYMLLGDREAGAEVFSAATDRVQASIVHREAINMVDASPDLSAVLTVNRSTYNIYDNETKSFYRSLSSTPSTNEGLNAHCIIADELHAWTGAAGRSLYDALRWAFAARRQPLFFQITTAGEDMLGVCREQHDYAKGVLAGTIDDDSFFPLIYGADPDDDPWDETTWFKANPSLGETITLESFRKDAAEAQRTPNSQARFKRYRLNIWTTSDSPWIRPEDWAVCYEPFDAESLAGRQCYAALDLSRTRDSTSLQLIFPPEDDGEDVLRLLSYFWIPEQQARDLRDVVPWQQWANSGHVTLIDGAVMEFGPVEDLLGELAQQFEILGLAYDPCYANELTLRVEENCGIPRILFKQTITNFAGPTAEFERRILGRSIRHNGQPVMSWQIGNAVIRTDVNNNKRPSKPTQNDPRKVDGVVAAVMATALTMQETPTFSSWYDEEGHEVEIG